MMGSLKEYSLRLKWLERFESIIWEKNDGSIMEQSVRVAGWEVLKSSVWEYNNGKYDRVQPDSSMMGRIV